MSESDNSNKMLAAPRSRAERSAGATADSGAGAEHSRMEKKQRQEGGEGGEVQQALQTTEYSWADLPASLLLKMFEILSMLPDGRAIVATANRVCRTWRMYATEVLLRDTAGSRPRRVYGVEVAPAASTQQTHAACLRADNDNSAATSSGGDAVESRQRKSTAQAARAARRAENRGIRRIARAQPVPQPQQAAAQGGGAASPSVAAAAAVGGEQEGQNDGEVSFGDSPEFVDEHAGSPARGGEDSGWQEAEGPSSDRRAHDATEGGPDMEDSVEQPTPRPRKQRGGAAASGARGTESGGGQRRRRGGGARTGGTGGTTGS